MAELQDCQHQETEGRLQPHLCLTLMAQVGIACWNQMGVPILVSLQLNGSYVGNLLYLIHFLQRVGIIIPTG